MKYLKSVIALFLVVILLSCTDQGSPASSGINAPTDKTLYQVAKFKIGCAVSVDLLRTNAAYLGLANKEYNSMTAENAMKFDAVHPEQTIFNFSDADHIVNTAKGTNKRIHGHALIWHQALPDWVTNFQGDSAAWENLFKTHITTVVNHFKADITSWDVVNEAFEDNGTLRNTIWRQKLGTDYVARAFKYANEADPNCKLFYNDYGTEYSSAKLTAVINMVNDLKRRGIPIHGIGSQMHTHINHSNTMINSSLQQLASTGLLIHISELDIRTNTANLPTATYSPTVEKALADKYKYIAQAYGKLPQAQQYGITLWNIGDADSWIVLWLNQKDWPCLFNDKYERKMAYNYFYSGIQ